MNSRIDSLEKDLESLQQYGRRNSLCFHNVPMNSDNIQGTDGLVLKVCKDHLGVELKIDDIDRSHIIGNITNGKGQIICRLRNWKLRNWKIKNKIYSNKRSLKNNPDDFVYTITILFCHHGMCQCYKDDYWDGRLCIHNNYIVVS